MKYNGHTDNMEIFIWYTIAMFWKKRVLGIDRIVFLVKFTLIFIVLLHNSVNWKTGNWELVLKIVSGELANIIPGLCRTASYCTK